MQRLITGSKLRYLIAQAEDVIWRRIGDDVVVIKDNGLATHVLNKTAAFIWESCDGKNDIDEITARLCQRFEVSADVAGQDVSELIERLTEVGIIKQIGETADE
jgi:hypothetical protein